MMDFQSFVNARESFSFDRDFPNFIFIVTFGSAKKGTTPVVDH